MFEGQQDSGPVSSRRRTVLKVIGGGAALTTGVVDTGSGREGSSGEEPVSGRELQDGVTNTVRNAANQIDLSSSPGGWTIRNVGFRGYRSAGTPMVAPAVTNPADPR